MSNSREATSGGAGAKAFGGVLAIIAVIVGVYSMVEPMNLRISAVETSFKTSLEKIDKISEEMSEIKKEVFERLSALTERNVRNEFMYDDLRIHLKEDSDRFIRLENKCFDVMRLYQSSQCAEIRK